MPTIEFSPRSTAIARVEYDTDTEQLDVIYANSGKRYTFYRVPEQEVEALRSAPSAGAYINNVIRPQYG